MPNGHVTLSDQVYFNPDEKKWRIIHKGVVQNETFDEEKQALQKFADLRAERLLEEGISGFNHGRHT